MKTVQCPICGKRREVSDECLIAMCPICIEKMEEVEDEY